MASKSNAGSGGIGLGGAVFLVFLVLKLTGNIDWSWWWVTAPLWGAIGLFIVIAASLIIGAIIIAYLKDWCGYKKKRIW